MRFIDAFILVALCGLWGCKREAVDCSDGAVRPLIDSVRFLEHKKSGEDNLQEETFEGLEWYRDKSEAWKEIFLIVESRCAALTPELIDTLDHIVCDYISRMSLNKYFRVSISCYRSNEHLWNIDMEESGWTDANIPYHHVDESDSWLAYSWMKGRYSGKYFFASGGHSIERLPCTEGYDEKVYDSADQ